MLSLLDKHSYIAVFIAVLLEELGIPMPIPTDLLIIYAGVKAHLELPLMSLWFIILNIASAIGATGLYFIVRRGGRPLLSKYGRYVHLGPAQLDRAEKLMSRGGWWSIAVARAIPGLRYLAVISCGLLNIPYARFITAHIVGSSVYIAVFLLLGSFFGPRIIEYVHLPELEIRLIWLAALAVGLPLLMAWFSYRGHAEYRVAPSRWRTLSALVVASFVGATSMAAAWAAAATMAELEHVPRSLNVTYELARVLLGRGLPSASAYMIVYTALLALCVGIGVLYYDVILPLISPRGTSLPRQTLGLTLLTVVLVSAFFIASLLLARGRPIDIWWRAGGPLLELALFIGIVCYALTTACTRALAIALLPSLRRTEQIPVVKPAAADTNETPASTSTLKTE